MRKMFYSIPFDSFIFHKAFTQFHNSHHFQRAELLQVRRGIFSPLGTRPKIHHRYLQSIRCEKEFLFISQLGFTLKQTLLQEPVAKAQHSISEAQRNWKLRGPFFFEVPPASCHEEHVASSTDFISEINRCSFFQVFGSI